MNPKTEKLLCDLARQVGGELKFATGLPVRFYGCQDTESPIAILNSDQPDSELIFTILHEIGHNYLHCKRKYQLPMPFYLNRPFENEAVGELAYKARRALRLLCGPEWQADLYALCGFCAIGCPEHLADFLKRHPEKWKYMPAVILGVMKARLITGFHKLMRPFKIRSGTS